MLIYKGLVGGPVFIFNTKTEKIRQKSFTHIHPVVLFWTFQSPCRPLDSNPRILKVPKAVVVLTKMEITRENFEQTFPLVEKSIIDCDFISIDAEFTGLHFSAPERKLDFLDSWQDRYHRLCVVEENDKSSGFQYRPWKNSGTATNFLIVQLGFCAFTFDAKSNKYFSKSFNFYIYPPHLDDLHDPNFLCQTQSLKVLGESGFDFNKVVRQGIPFLRRFNKANAHF